MTVRPGGLESLIIQDPVFRKPAVETSQIQEGRVNVSVKGKPTSLPAVDVDGAVVVASGRFPRIAVVKDEGFVEAQVLRNPGAFVDGVAASGLPADVLTFTQEIDEPIPRCSYYSEPDNVAAADTSSFADWWDRLPQATRKNCRRAERRGVSTRLARLDEELARGIKGIYDETPTRQGRRFWHYGKDLSRVLQENGDYLDRSEFIAAYHGQDLIGFMKIVYVGRVARIMQVLSRVAHYDKRPMNVLIAKAVEVCSDKGMSHLVYGKFQYGNKVSASIMEFKTRNGFHRLDFPRYYVPLTWRGRIAIGWGLHRGLLGILPAGVIDKALRARQVAGRLLTLRRSDPQGSPEAAPRDSAQD